MKNQQW